MRYEPAYLIKRTGLRTFNAGVNGIGGTADAWAMSQFIHEVWPDAHPPYLWLLDVEAFVPSRSGRAPPTSRVSPSTSAQPAAGKGVVELVRAIGRTA